MSNSNFKSDNISYQQFETTNYDKYFDKRLNQERKKIIKKLKKILTIFMSFIIFVLFLITLILYLKKLRDYRELEIKVMDHIFFPYHSDLIPNLKVLKKLKKWIKKIILEKTGIEYQPSLRMYYKATRDGDHSFHDKTDQWQGYILLIKDEKNNLFGGYTSKNFKGNLILSSYYPSEKVDKTAFLFNLDKDEIYPIIDDNAQCHICGDIEEGPIFGSPNSDLSISYKFLSVNSYSEFPKYYNLKGNNNIKKNKLKLTNGQTKFRIKELEVFRVNLLS